MQKNKKILFIFFVVLFAGACVFALQKISQRQASLPPKNNAYIPSASDSIQEARVLINVPFTAQAPTGNWSDPKQEDGCEEASVLMAWSWVQNQALNKETAEKTIIDMSDFEQNKYGNYHDFNAEDTAKFMKDYY